VCEPGRSYGGDRGHLLQRGRKTRRRRETRLTRWDRSVSDGACVRSGRADDARAGPRDERVGLLWAKQAEAECGAGLQAGKRERERARLMGAGPRGRVRDWARLAGLRGADLCGLGQRGRWAAVERGNQRTGLWVWFAGLPGGFGLGSSFSFSFYFYFYFYFSSYSN